MVLWPYLVYIHVNGLKYKVLYIIEWINIDQSRFNLNIYDRDKKKSHLREKEKSFWRLLYRKQKIKKYILFYTDSLIIIQLYSAVLRNKIVLHDYQIKYHVILFESHYCYKISFIRSGYMLAYCGSHLIFLTLLLFSHHEIRNPVEFLLAIPV